MYMSQTLDFPGAPGVLSPHTVENEPKLLPLQTHLLPGPTEPRCRPFPLLRPLIGPLPQAHGHHLIYPRDEAYSGPEARGPV